MKRVLLALVLIAAARAQNLLPSPISGGTGGGGGGTGCVPTGSAGQVLSDDGAGACSSNSTAAGFLTFMGTPSSANLIALLTNETGTSLAVFNTSPLLVTPKVTSITDANGNPFIISAATASAVDSITVTNAATANPATVIIGATGSDTNISLSLVAKGSGTVQLPGGTVVGNGSGVAGGLLMNQGTATTPSANSIVIEAPTSVTTAYRLDLAPAASTGIPHYANSSNVITETISSVVSADLNITTTTCTAPQVLTAISATAVGTCTAPLLTQNSQSADYTLVLGDAGKQIYHPGADTTTRTITIPANGSVAYAIGTCVSFFNDTSAGTWTIAITTDTMVLAGAGTTGSRTLTASNEATVCKITSTRWMISGSSGLT